MSVFSKISQRAISYSFPFSPSFSSFFVNAFHTQLCVRCNFPAAKLMLKGPEPCVRMNESTARLACGIPDTEL